MKYIETDFSKELTELCLKHKKRFEVDKYGIHIVDDTVGSSFVIATQTLGSENCKDTLIQIIKC